jgi:Ca2+-binding RTX toxin-like protein
MIGNVRIEPLESRRLFNFAPFGQEVTVPTSGSSGTADVAVAGDGSYIIVTSAFGGGTFKVSAVRYAPTGEQLGQPYLLYQRPLPGFSESDVSAAMDGDGDAVVAFEAFSADGLTSYIMVTRVSRKGVKSPSVAVATLTDNDPDDFPRVTAPAISMDDNGRYFVGWLREVDQNDNTLQFRSFNADGSPRGATFDVAPEHVGLQFIRDLDLSTTRAGESAAFAYQTLYSDSHEAEIFTGRISTTAMISSTLGRVENDAPFDPTIVAIDDGSYVVGYENRPSDALFGNREFDEAECESVVQRFDASNERAGGPINIGMQLGNDGLGVVEPAIARIGGNGAFVATYRKGTTLFAQRYSATVVSDDAGPVDIDMGVFRDTRIGAAPSGDAVAVYIEDGGGANEFSTHSRRLTSAVAAIDNSVLYVLGSRRSDAMSVKQRGGSVFAARGNESLKFAASRVTSIWFEGLNGNDVILNATSKNSVIRGGSGNDSLFGGTSDDRIYGHGGQDLLSGGGGVDVLRQV